jgi:hypothetical protein
MAQSEEEPPFAGRRRYGSNRGCLLILAALSLLGSVLCLVLPGYYLHDRDTGEWGYHDLDEYRGTRAAHVGTALVVAAFFVIWAVCLPSFVLDDRGVQKRRWFWRTRVPWEEIGGVEGPTTGRPPMGKRGSWRVLDFWGRRLFRIGRATENAEELVAQIRRRVSATWSRSHPKPEMDGHGLEHGRGSPSRTAIPGPVAGEAGSAASPDAAPSQGSGTGKKQIRELLRACPECGAQYQVSRRRCPDCGALFITARLKREDERREQEGRDLHDEIWP